MARVYARKKAFNGDPDGAMKAHVAALNKQCSFCTQRAQTATRIFLPVDELQRHPQFLAATRKAYPSGVAPMITTPDGIRAVKVGEMFACASCTPYSQRQLAHVGTSAILFDVDFGPIYANGISVSPS